MSCGIIFGLLAIQAVSSIDFTVISGGIVDEDSLPDSLYNPFGGDAMQLINHGEYFEEWIVHQYFNKNSTTFPNVSLSNASFDNVASLYNNITELNSVITANSKSGQIVIGDLIICQECNGTLAIGPNYIGWLQEYYPVYINSNWDLNQIINAGNESYSSFYSIYINAFYYAVHNGLSDAFGETGDAINNKLFPNRTSTKSVGSITPLYQDGSIPDNAILGTIEVRYSSSDNAIGNIWQNLGDPYSWSTLYNQYYWQELDGSLVIYIYGLSVQCPNDNVCQQFKTGPTTIPPTTTYDDSSANILFNKDFVCLLLTASIAIWIFA